VNGYGNVYDKIWPEIYPESGTVFKSCGYGRISKLNLSIREASMSSKPEKDNLVYSLPSDFLRSKEHYQSIRPHYIIFQHRSRLPNLFSKALRELFM